MVQISHRETSGLSLAAEPCSKHREILELECRIQEKPCFGIWDGGRALDSLDKLNFPVFSIPTYHQKQ